MWCIIYFYKYTKQKGRIYMKLVEDKIRELGKIGEGDVLKVDSFLNHQMDPMLLADMGEEFYRLFKNENVTKILTIEASGIGVATMTAYKFGVPMVFAKKTKTNNIYADVYKSTVESYTHKKTYEIVVSREFINPGDKVLIVDDFLAKGSALLALISLVKAAGAEVVGCGVVIEKEYQGGGKIVRDSGIRVEGLARIKEMSVENGITYC